MTVHTSYTDGTSVAVGWDPMLGLTPRKANLNALQRRAMLDTLLRHLPMVRLSVGALAALLFLGCSGLIDDTDGNITPEEKLARQLFVQKAKPVFEVASCNSCHTGSDPTVAFLAGENPMKVRATLL